MKKMLKKILVYTFFIPFVISCFSLTAQEKYDRGDYLGSLVETAKELEKNEFKDGERELAIARLKNIVKYYDEKLKYSQDTQSRALAYLDLWKIEEIVFSNPILSKYIGVTENNDNLYKATENMFSYVSQSPSNRISDLEDFLYTVEKYSRRSRNLEYTNLIERRIIQILLDEASYYESSRNYEKALNMYARALKYDLIRQRSDYSSIQSRYNGIKRAIDLNKADKYFNNAVKYYNELRYELAKENFENASRIYRKYNEQSKLQQIKVYYENIDYKLFEKYSRLGDEKEQIADRYQYSSYRQDYNSYREQRLRYYQEAINNYQASLNYVNNDYNYRMILARIENVKQKMNQLRK